MSTGDKIGVEISEFKNNEIPKNFEYWKTSTFHFCVQDPDVEGLVEKICSIEIVLWRPSGAQPSFGSDSFG